VVKPSQEDVQARGVQCAWGLQSFRGLDRQGCLSYEQGFWAYKDAVPSSWIGQASSLAASHPQVG